jgi:hypothetical protein
MARPGRQQPAKLRHLNQFRWGGFHPLLHNPPRSTRSRRRGSHVMDALSSHEMRLRIESVNGAPINDYRIRDGGVEVRSLEPSGQPYPDATSDWRVLDSSDIQAHRMLRTVVWRWLRVRLGTDASDPRW